MMVLAAQKKRLEEQNQSALLLMIEDINCPHSRQYIDELSKSKGPKRSYSIWVIPEQAAAASSN